MRILAIFACIFLFLINGRVSAKDTVVVADSLESYYLKKLENITDPAVLSIADTLFNLGEKHNQPAIQVTAMVAKLNHYYYSQNENSTDSIIAWVNRIKAFSRKHNFLEQYYFVWSSKLINHYIGLGESNIALVEAEKMLKEAEADDFKEGVAACYFSLSNIYSAKLLIDKSQEFMLKEIELFEKYDLDRFNISLQYSDAARIYIDKGELEKASDLLEKASKHARNPYHKVTMKLAYVLYYLAEGNEALATQYYEECRQMFANEKVLIRHIHYLYEVEVIYYTKLRKYEQALASLDFREQALIDKNETISVISLLKTRADIYWEMGKKEEAAFYYKEYIQEDEKIKEKYEETTTAEFATLLNMQKLTAEKNEFEQLSQKKQLQNTQIIVFFLVVLLAIVFIFLYYQGKLNRRLKISRDELREKNDILIKAEKELVRAKEMAEESSHLKTVFIQNMSHEIRTPLNSIVGFSAVLADMFSDENEEIKLYSSLIEDNSKLLLKLISDILDISALDEFKQEIEIKPTDINSCCLNCIEETRGLTKEGVRMSFQPQFPDLTVETNYDMVAQVLRNLLNNATKFTNTGEITLAYTVNEKELLFTVTDTGIGIPVEQQEYIFERFVKLNEFTQGTGLGLSISRMVAEKLGGHLIVDKEYTQGSRFMFSIPV